jgi:phage gp16-like protein
LRQPGSDGLINREQFGNALRNLVDEGVKIRRDLERELAKPSQQALRVADVRSSEGIAAFFQAGRQDPAIQQREQQLRRLQEIRDAVQRNNLQVVEI